MTYILDSIDVVIHRDHKMINKVCEMTCKMMKGNDLDHAKKWKNLFVNEVARHIVAEELVYYPKQDLVLEKEVTNLRLQEHEHVKMELSKLDELEVEDKHFICQLGVALQVFNSHCLKEEEDIQKFKAQVTEEKMQELGKAFLAEKKSVPTHPHPGMSDQGGTMEKVATRLLTPFDKLRDKIRDFPSEDELRLLVD